MDELFRVAANSVIISMPNAWNYIKYIVGGFKGQISKARPRSIPDRHWTLPTNKPFDRHRWFYSLSEADRLLRHRGKDAGFEVREYNPHVISKGGISLNNIICLIHKRIWSEEDFSNLYAWVGWWVLCRINNA